MATTSGRCTKSPAYAHARLQRPERPGYLPRGLLPASANQLTTTRAVNAGDLMTGGG